MRAAAKNAAAVLGVLILSAAVGLTVGCPTKRLVGIPCPGCGMTRACLSLLRLDFAAALRWHPLCFLMPPVCAAFVFKDTRFGKRLWGCKALLVGLIIEALLVYAVRMYLYFPYAAPMDLENNAVIVKIVHRFILH